MSHRRNGLRRRVTEAKEGPLELRRKEAKYTQKEESSECVLERVSGLWVSTLEGFYQDVSGDLNRIFISFPGVSRSH